MNEQAECDCADARRSNPVVAHGRPPRKQDDERRTVFAHPAFLQRAGARSDASLARIPSTDSTSTVSRLAEALHSLPQDLMSPPPGPSRSPGLSYGRPVKKFTSASSNV